MKKVCSDPTVVYYFERRSAKIDAECVMAYHSVLRSNTQVIHDPSLIHTIFLNIFHTPQLIVTPILIKVFREFYPMSITPTLQLYSPESTAPQLRSRHGLFYGEVVGR